MKDKEKQIEEMAKIIDDRLIEARDYLGSMNKGEGYWIAQRLIEHYQPKIDKDSVVLSREEYESLQNLLTKRQNVIDSYRKCIDKRNSAIKQASKETAEKIILSEIATIKNIRDACVLPTPKYKEGYIDCCNGILFYLKNNISKQFGVEIKE